MPERSSGLLLHISSLPSAWGKGDFGMESYKFIDWLERTEQSLWQILPLTYPDMTGSPYASPSANAINPDFVSPDMLRKDGLLNDDEWEYCQWVRDGDVHDVRQQAFMLAYVNWKNRPDDDEFTVFCNDHSYWLDDTALFMTIREYFPGSWYDFPEGLRNRDKEAVTQWEREHADDILQFKFEQFILFRQWGRIKSYANEKNIRIIGDIPVFISTDSADVWSHRKLFKLDEQGVPKVLTGVPPDLFTSTGQLWGQPHFDWKAMKSDDYRWWIERVRVGKLHADILRIDHFRGFCAAYEIPYGAETAMNGEWVEGPRDDIFHILHRHIPGLYIIAEDLGVITPDVTALRKRFHYPGMKVLQFAFNSDENNTYLPENFDPEDRFVVYTGTHDNNTTRGWYENADKNEKEMLRRYIKKDTGIVWELIKMAFYSNAMWAVIPLQDLLGLGSSARMNTPGTVMGNWKWQLDEFNLPEERAQELRDLTRESGRDTPLTV